MQNRIVLGVSVGESFAEFSLIQNPVSLSAMKVLAQKRSYLPRENIKNSLSQFLEANKDTAPSHIFLSLGYLEKLLTLRLGGSVAQVVTEGFEHWPDVRSCKHDGTTLSSPDLIFAVRERTTVQGQIHTPLKLEDLEAIAAKLKLMDCKRVCIHFIHASVNGAHESQAAAFFKEQGFEVFVPQKTDNPDEVSRWRKNTLNASVSGTFAELRNEITEAVKSFVAAENIFFLNGEGKIFRDETSERISSIFAAQTALVTSCAVTKDTDLLHLGLENFSLMHSHQWTDRWVSDWGQIEIPHTKTKKISLQPTSEIELNSFKHFDFSSQTISWEPGPMMFGRGQKPALLDLWGDNTKIENIEGLKDRLVPAGVQRFRSSLLTLWKTCRLRSQEIDHMMKDLQSLAIQTVALEATLHRKNKKLLVVGPLAPLFANGFKKDPDVQILTQDFIESSATALCGFKSLGVQP